MKTLSLLLTGLLISCISFSKPTAKKEASHVTIENRRSNNLTGTYASPLSPFSTEIDQELINKKVNALNLHRMKFNQAPFSVKVVTLSPADYEAQKPAGSFAFDAGYVDASGKVFVSEPTTSAQQSTFTDINQAALYYVCQSFLQYYYQTTEMPIWFKSGFASYEADMRIDDVVIKTAYQNYGGTLTSFSALNNPTSFAANNGFAVSYMFGEFMGVLKVWNYYMISRVNATTIIPFSWWDIKTVDQLFEIWMRYFNVRILEDNEQNRIKLGKESKHFKFYYSNSKDFWAAYFPGVLDNAITEYIGLLDFDVFEKFSYITMPECDFAAIGGRTCINRYTGGTAWSSGLSSTSPDNTKDFDRFKRLIRHELSHLVQRHLPAGNMTAWLNEGFAQFMSHKPHTQKDIDDLQSATNKTLNKAISYFGHLPTYEDTKVYPGQSNVDYYLLGEIMLNFIYQNGGYPAVKDVIMHPETGIANMGYSSVKAFMAAYYNFVNVVYLKKGAADYFNNYDAFITKLTNLTSSADSSTLLNAFWDDLIATGNFPFAIGTKVAFLYRGSASSINWAGMFNNWNKDADVGHRLGVSDIWMLEKEFPKDTRCEYKVVKNGSEWLADPNNPHPLVGSYNNSELWMPDYSKHTELIPQSGIAKGKLSANILKNSSKLGYTSQYRVYTPAGYTMLSGLPTIYVTDGQNYLDNNMGKMITVLDNLIADGTIQPVIAIFLDPRDPNNLSNDRRGNEYRNNINFAKYVTLELIPDIDAAYKTNTSADARAIMGASYGGYNAVYFGVAAADYFHKFGINSAYLHPNGSYNIDSKLQAANLDNLNFYLSYGTFDSDGERYFNRLKNIFDQKNSEYEFNIIGDGHTWQNWSRVIGDALEYFFPKPDTISLSLTSPNGGEYFIPGDTMNIKWNASGISDIKIEFSPDNGSNWSPISNSTAAALGSYDWTIPNTISNQCKIRITDIANATVFDESDNVFEIGAEIITSNIADSVPPLLSTTWHQVWPYNAYYPKQDSVPESFNGRYRLGCIVTAQAQIMKYWEYPIQGQNIIDTYHQDWGNIYIDLSQRIYDWDQMPDYLPPDLNMPEKEYEASATLCRDVCNSLIPEEHNKSGYLNSIYSLSHFFGYAEDSMKIIRREEVTQEVWENIIKNELSLGRPIMVAASGDVEGLGGHAFICDGYNKEGLFHFNLGWAALTSYVNGYYTLENMGGHIYNQLILVGIQPDLNGKKLSLSCHNGGEIVISGEETQITWNSTNVSNIKIEYTINSGQSWEVITSNTPAAAGSYNWTTPTVSSDDCKIKLTDVSNINVYDKSNAVFSIKPYELTLNTPNGSGYYVAGSSISISWEISPVSNIKIEYTTNNGNSWDVVASNVDASLGIYDWVIPNTISNQCKIKISDISNSTVFDISDNTFEIGLPINTGGPYATDDHTVLLMHFNGDLTNSSTLSGDGVPIGSRISYSYEALVNQNQCLNLDGTSYITIPHNTNLNLHDDWTIEAWIKVTAFNSGTQSIIVRKPGDSDDYNANYNLELHPWWGNVLNGFYFSDDATRINVTEMSPTLNQWYHVAFIRDVSNSRISIIVHDENGNEVSSSSQKYSSNDVLFSSKDLRIGEAFDGYIDELRISNVVRSFENTTGVPKNTFGRLISIWPNPARKVVHISSPETVNLVIFNLSGQKILEKKNFLSGNIDVSIFKKGFYLVQFSCEKGIINKKIIIE